MSSDRPPIELSESNFHPAEYWIMLITLFICLADLGILLYMFAHRNYPPIRSKQLGLVAVSLIAGFFWIIGNLISKFVLRSNAIAESCQLWLIWIYLFFGGFSWISTIILRLWRLHCLLVQPKMHSTVGTYRWLITRFLGIASGGYLCCIVLSATDSVEADIFDIVGGGTIALCTFKPNIATVVLVIALVYFAVALGLSYTLRNVRLSFNEYSGARFAGCTMIGIIIAYMVTLYIRNYSVAIRVSSGLLLIIAVQLYFYIVVLKPVLGCYLDHDGYAEQFRREMKIDSSNGKAKVNSDVKTTDMRSNNSPNTGRSAPTSPQPTSPYVDDADEQSLDVLEEKS